MQPQATASSAWPFWPWAVTAAVSRISSLAALAAAASSGIWLLVFAQGRMVIVVFVMMILVYLRHSANIARLQSGTEPKIGAK
jgi:glycerol-3-phosphate acyltransferase PlsY